MRYFVAFLLIIIGIEIGFILSPRVTKSYPVATVVSTNPTETPTPTSYPRSISLSAEKLTALVNDWRVSQGFQPYVKNEDLCIIAEDRADEGPDYHEGFVNKYSNHPSVIQENLVGADTEKQALGEWLTSPPHKSTLEKPYKYSCIACYKNQCNQIFSNLENGTR